MMKFKVPIYEPFLDDDDVAYVSDCVKSGWISSKGQNIIKFESVFSNFIGTKYGISNCNGTASLQLALAGLNLSPNDEIILPSFTFVSTANAVKHAGCKCIFADIDRETWCIDPSSILNKITNNTKAIIPVHIYGHPCDMDEILKIARDHDLYVIEDCAESHGAKYKNHFTGSFGDVSCFSFYGNKIITTGEGGMCCTDKSSLADKLRILRDHGIDPNQTYLGKYLGFNFRMTNIQAALGLSQMKKINKILQLKRRNALIYNDLLEHNSNITLPVEKRWAKNVYWMYSILVRSKKERDKLMNHLYKKGIETRPFFYPIHKMPIHLTKESLRITENISQRGLNLPSGNTLSIEQIHYVCDSIKSFYD